MTVCISLPSQNPLLPGLRRQLNCSREEELVGFENRRQGEVDRCLHARRVGLHLGGGCQVWVRSRRHRAHQNWSVSCQRPTFRTQFRLVHGLLHSGLTALGSACFRTGEMFNPNGMTAAHRSLPFGTCLVVGNPRTGRMVAVRVNDRGGLRWTCLQERHRLSVCARQKA